VIGHGAQKYGAAHRRVAALQRCKTKPVLAMKATIFHDCVTSELAVRQLRNQRATDLSPYGLRLDVFHFDGSFLSVVIDLPKASVDGLRRRHIIRMDAQVEIEKPLEIFARPQHQAWAKYGSDCTRAAPERL
jgi:hypothetical protein